MLNMGSATLEIFDEAQAETYELFLEIMLEMVRRVCFCMSGHKKVSCAARGQV
jgi:hypothetical protein